MRRGAFSGTQRRAEPGADGATAWHVDERQPKYLRIHSNLRERITSGQWPPGSPLPSQRELADEFGVSVMTLRQALQLLTEEDFIDPPHGSPTFPAARYAYDLGHLRSF